MRILITGGAGFVGAGLALAFRAREPRAEVVAFDSLRRRGSELNLPRLARHGVAFVRGDVRSEADLERLPGSFDWIVDAAAEPSVHAGLDGSPAEVIQTNLVGTANCLELARRRAGGLVFLSTSRVHAIPALAALPLRETPTRFELEAPEGVAGLSEHGIAEGFTGDGPRSYYGASKLAAELLVQEYAAHARVPALIDRCGVIAGAGQFGRVDQGVFTLWVAHHRFGLPLRYLGYGGSGKQVRDLLHPDDLFALLWQQLADAEAHAGGVFAVGGGNEGSTSLLEYTELCAELSGRRLVPEPVAETAGVDVPWFVTDSRRARRAFGWAPKRGVREIASDIHAWLVENEAQLRPLFAAA